ncbi:hypothetical protein [Marinoscillum sp.]|uniref:hypothetical protein n=1 Tax=Marinoscillum sp. TaxID=2024838 RepID=UPI003BA84305
MPKAISSLNTKRIFLILGVLALVGCIGLLVDTIAKRELPKLLGEQVTYESVSLSILNGEISFKKPRVQVDSAENQANLNIRSEASQISIHGFSLWNLLLSRKIRVDKLSIDSLLLGIVLPELKASKTEKKEINLFVRDIFNRIEVQHFDISAGSLVVRKKGSYDTLMSMKDIHLSAYGIFVDTSTVHNIFPLDFHKSETKVGQLYIKAGDDYTLSGESLQIRDTSFSIENLHLKPVDSRPAFVQNHPYEKARIDLMVKRLSGEKLLWDFMENRTLKLSAESTLLDKLQMNVFKDKTPPAKPPETRPLLAGFLNKLPFIFTLDTLRLTDSYIQYEQLPVVFPRAGKLYFEKLYMSGYHLTNDPEEIQKQAITTLDIQSDFMGQGKLKTTILLDMSSKRQEFSVSGTLGAMPITYINQTLAPLTGVEASGHLHGMTFDFQGDEYASKGKVIMEYSDLKVNVYDQNRDKVWLKSMFGNMILNSNNHIDDTLGYQEGEIYFIRYQNKGFFNMLWNSLRVALMDITMPFYTNPDYTTPGSEPKYLLDD